MTEPIGDESGILPVHKPSGMTSRQIVDQIEDLLHSNQKVGHGGTLDRKAEGVLPILIGEATKLTQYLHQRPKRYIVRGRFDLTSETLDLDGEIRTIDPDYQPDENQIKKHLTQFQGSFQQRPPKISAVKHQGKRLHQINRDGRDVEAETRTVQCHSLELIRNEFPSMDFEIKCGKGYYVRSFVRDLADSLGLPGAMVTVLVRNQYGTYNLNQSWNPLGNDPPRNWLRKLNTAVEHLPFYVCNDEELQLVTNGNWIPRDSSSELAVALDRRKRVHAILEARNDRGDPEWKPKRVLNRIEKN